MTANPPLPNYLSHERLHLKVSKRNQALARTLDNTIRMLIKPAFAWFPGIRLQRGWIELIAKVNHINRAAKRTQSRIGGVLVEIHTGPNYEAGDGATLLYLHGGGYCLGSARTHRSIASHLAVAANAKVVVPDYRLAPENPFPAGLEDVLNVYLALLKDHTGCHRLFVGGDSAGGGLSLALARELHEKQAALPAGLILYSPWVNQQTESNRFGREENMLPSNWLQRCSQNYAGKQLQNPKVSPILGDWRWLPPLEVQAGSKEGLVAQIIAFCDRLVDQGCQVYYREYAEMWHVFQLQVGLIAEADHAIKSSAEFIQAQLDAVK